MKTIYLKRSVEGLLVTTIAIASCQIASAATYESLESSWYIGGAVGMSGLEPDGHSNWDVTDDNDMAKKVYGGFNIGRDFGLEAFWNDFGEAGVTNKAGDEAKVKYSGYGANLVYHVPSYLGSLHPIAKVGVAKLNTKGEGVSVNQKNNFDVMAGIGAEYELDGGFRIRAEYEYFDKDIDQVSIGLNWRPVLTRKSIDIPRPAEKQPIVIVNNPAPVYRSAPVAPPKPIIKTVVKHVPVYIKQPAPKPIVKTIIKQAPPVVHRVEVVRPAPAPVKRPPPRTIHKTLAGGSHFATNSASLTNAGRSALDRLASDLLRDKVVIHNIGIIGHTDSIGNPLANQRLSESRARTVANYLGGRGLNRRIMTVLGRGETQPLASNATDAGRAQNRRVNIVVKGSQTIRR